VLCEKPPDTFTATMAERSALTEMPAGRSRRCATVDWLSDSPNASTAVAIDVDDELGRRLSRVSELV
jgi:hypothetical protein